MDGVLLNLQLSQVNYFGLTEDKWMLTSHLPSTVTDVQLL